MKFKLDENLGIRTQHLFLEAGHDIQTIREAIWNIREAIEGDIAALEEDGLPVPEERFELLTVAV